MDTDSRVFGDRVRSTAGFLSQAEFETANARASLMGRVKVEQRDARAFAAAWEAFRNACGAKEMRRFLGVGYGRMRAKYTQIRAECRANGEDV
jgi:hypothetical protein